MGLRDIVFPCVSWVIGDGRKVRFLQDKWLLNEPLRSYTTMDLPSVVEGRNVYEYWRNGTGWLFAQIEPFVPSHLMLML